MAAAECRGPRAARLFNLLILKLLSADIMRVENIFVFLQFSVMQIWQFQLLIHQPVACTPPYIYTFSLATASKNLQNLY
jgi:hypothetical protein